MTESLKAGKVITLPTVGLFADGAAVRTVGQETFRVSMFLSDRLSSFLLFFWWDSYCFVVATKCMIEVMVRLCCGSVCDEDLGHPIRILI